MVTLNFMFYTLVSRNVT